MNYTIIKTSKGETLNFTTQQYQIGTYCIINNDPGKQFGVDMDEVKFHKKLQRQAKKQGDEVMETSIR